jgi:hypothetical protein
MPDFRAFWVPASAEPAEILLAPDESRHLVAVTRGLHRDGF